MHEIHWYITRGRCTTFLSRGNSREEFHSSPGKIVSSKLQLKPDVVVDVVVGIADV